MKFYFKEDVTDATGRGGPIPDMNREVEADKVVTQASANRTKVSLDIYR